MSLFFGTDYDDKRLRSTAELAVKEHPLLKLANVDILVEDGIITIMGKTNSENKKDKIIEEITKKIEHVGLEYEEIVNKVEIE